MKRYVGRSGKNEHMCHNGEGAGKISSDVVCCWYMAAVARRDETRGLLYAWLKNAQLVPWSTNQTFFPLVKSRESCLKISQVKNASSRELSIVPTPNFPPTPTQSKDRYQKNVYPKQYAIFCLFPCHTQTAWIFVSRKNQVCVKLPWLTFILFVSAPRVLEMVYYALPTVSPEKNAEYACLPGRLGAWADVGTTI